MNDIKVSIIIPVYNVQNYIEECLKSVIRQTYKGAIECILIDDCGNDESMEIVEQFLGRYNGKIDFKILHHDKNRGLSAARNTGIDNSTGDYLYFLDSDDEITPDCIENITSPLRQNYNPDFIIGGYDIVGKKDDVPRLTLASGIVVRGNDIFETFIAGKWYMMAWNKLCNRRFLIDYNLYFKEGIIHEDDLWSFQLAYHAKNMIVSTGIGYIYKIREGSITGNYRMDKSIRNYIEVLYCILEFIKSEGIKLTPQLNQFIQGQMYFILFSAYSIFEKNEFLKAYYRLRTHSSFSPLDMIKCNKFNLKKYIRDLHLILPDNIGVKFEQLLISRMRPHL